MRLYESDYRLNTAGASTAPDRVALSKDEGRNGETKRTTGTNRGYNPSIIIQLYRRYRNIIIDVYSVYANKHKYYIRMQLRSVMEHGCGNSSFPA